jgi:hypothetical protein
MIRQPNSHPWKNQGDQPRQNQRKSPVLTRYRECPIWQCASTLMVTGDRELKIKQGCLATQNIYFGKALKNASTSPA